MKTDLYIQNDKYLVMNIMNLEEEKKKEFDFKFY